MLEAVVIGAGQAGLAVSQVLGREGVDHVVLERGRIGETWRTQRWDSFALNTPAWMNRLPGDDDAAVGEPADGFWTHHEFARRLDAYAHRWRLPVREHSPVLRVRTVGGGFHVDVDDASGTSFETHSVVVASGVQNIQRIPPIATSMPPELVEIPALEYRDPGALPPGAVLVVGSGQTGGQIAEDLLEAGRTVYLSASRVARMRRRYRGRDIFEWLIQSGYFDVPIEDVPDPAVRSMTLPLISGVGRYGHSLGLQWLAARGVVLLGRIRSVVGSVLELEDTLGECIRFGDERSGSVRRMVDEGLQARGIPLPEVEDDPADLSHPDPASVHSSDRLDLASAGVGSVIWATGVRGEFPFLAPFAVGEDGVPIQELGVGLMPGLYCLGFPWLLHRGSGIVYGVGKDAGRIADHVVRRAEEASG